MSVHIDSHVIRGPESWNFFYIVLGFTLAIEGTIIQMIPFLIFPCNILLYVVVIATTFWMFLGNPWLHNKLVGWKISYESKPR